MSRIAKNSIKIHKDISCSFQNGNFNAKGKLGEMDLLVDPLYTVDIQETEIFVNPKAEKDKLNPKWGTMRSLISNIIIGVSIGFSKTLELNGTGYRASVSGTNLKLQLGFSHDINFNIPDGVKIQVEKQVILKISGTDKQQVGMVAAEIKSIRPPEPYKGKGIKEQGQYILRKEGKKK